MSPYYEEDGIVIYHADCLDVLGRLTHEIDVCITDPPYNVGLDYSDGDRRPDYEEWCAEWFALLPQPVVVTPGIVNVSMWLRIQEPRWICAWMKPNQCSASALNGFNAWEPVLVYGKHRKPVGQDVWVVPVSQQSEAVGHPCPKSEVFWRSLLMDFTKPGDVILDPFGGSGTTAVAAKRLGRRAVVIEKHEPFCEMTVRRLRQGALPMFGEATA